ncbi:MAG: hypothetical protein KJ072_15610 [Verrucomicrobia bacterium]|nr:hypothetical protein [Verrucomicrobiota bacterium]
MLANIDNNIWGLLVVPVGLVLGFGPAIAAWLWMSYRPQTRTGQNPRNRLETEE